MDHLKYVLANMHRKEAFDDYGSTELFLDCESRRLRMEYS